MLDIGIIGHEEWEVTKDKLASSIKSGNVDVFATPYMIALMELTCANSIKNKLAANQSSVGILVNITHTSATPLGMKVWCDAKLIKIDGRKLLFEVVAHDEYGVIGNGTHERFIIDNEKFLHRLKKKLVK